MKNIWKKKKQKNIQSELKFKKKKIKLCIKIALGFIIQKSFIYFLFAT